MPVAVGVPGVPLATPPASVTSPVTSPVITAASLVPWMVIATTWAVPSAARTVKCRSAAAGIEPLHRGIAVVQRVGPHPARRRRIGAVAVGAGRAGHHRLEGCRALSRSVSVSVPVAVGVPGVPLATPPARSRRPSRRP